MCDRSVITLQIGHYANHIGAHFWNIQESLAYNNVSRELNHDILFREGLTPNTRDVTYLPRLVVVDLKGSLGLLPEFGDLYEDVLIPGGSKAQLTASGDGLWHGQFEVQREEMKRKNDFLAALEREEKSIRNPQRDEDKDVCEGASSDETKKIFSLNEDDVKVWSDFIRMRYHPKTNCILKEYQHNNTTKPFDIFGLGVAEAKGTFDDYEDRVRFFAEECDYLEGFQIVVDSDDAFGGYGSEVVRYLRDDFGSKSIAVFPTFPANVSDPLQNLGRFLNTTLAFQSLGQESNLVSPLSLSSDTFPLRNGQRHFEDLHFRPEVAYHSSAILATALDCITLPWRLKTARSRHSMLDVVSGLANHGRKFANVALALPFPGNESPNSSLAELLPNVEHDDTFGLTSLTPAVNFTKDGTTMMALSARGLESRLKPSGFSLSDPHWQKEYSRNVYMRTDTVNQALLCHFSQHWGDTIVGVTSAEAGSPVSTPYPKMFAKQKPDSSISTLAAWSSSAGTGIMLRKMMDRFSKINLGKLHRFREAGLDCDDIGSILEDLDTLAKSYEPDVLL